MCVEGAGNQVGSATKVLRQEESGSTPLLVAFRPHFAKTELGTGVVCGTENPVLEPGFCLLLLP